MLNEVTRLCKGNFSDLIKEYKVVHKTLCGSSTISTFRLKIDAEKFKQEKEQEYRFYDDYLEIEEVKYEKNRSNSDTCRC